MKTLLIIPQAKEVNPSALVEALAHRYEEAVVDTPKTTLI
jgi:hypothetical protein